MKKKFKLENVTITVQGRGEVNKMVFSAYDESNQKFVEMLLMPQNITTVKNNNGKINKVIAGSIDEIIKYE